MHRYRRPFVLPLIVLFLLGQVVPALWRMDCLHSGRSVVSWGQARSCVPAAKDKAAHFAPTCCKYSHAGGERSDFVHQAPPEVPDMAVVPIDWSVAVPTAEADVPPTLRGARPPPLITSDRTVLLRRLLI